MISIEEIWKGIKDYEGYYEVSNMGRVRGLDRDVVQGNHIVHRKCRIIAQVKDGSGYLQLKLCKDGVCSTRRVNILVAKAFIENRDYKDGWEVNHKDLDKCNNTASNLEWCTRTENVSYSASFGRYSHYGKSNPNFGGTKLKKRFEENPELKKFLARKGAQNGRCVPVSMTKIETNEVLSFNYIGECCEFIRNNNLSKAKIESIRNTIVRHMNNQTPYKGYIFRYM